MSSVRVRMKDGTLRSFSHEGRPGGSYSKTLSFDAAFAIITDEYGTRTCIPAADIAEITETPERRGGW